MLLLLPVWHRHCIYYMSFLSLVGKVHTFTWSICLKNMHFLPCESTLSQLFIVKEHLISNLKSKPVIVSKTKEAQKPPKANIYRNPAPWVSIAENGTVVVSDHSDTENDSNEVNNRFSADLYLTESCFYFLFIRDHTPAAGLRKHARQRNTTPAVKWTNRTMRQNVNISTTVGGLMPATLSFISTVKPFSV